MAEIKKRSWWEYCTITLRGICMGAADVVPGVSGGTIAFIVGIYEELIDSIRTLASVDTIKMLCRFELKRAWDELPWRFLLALGLGIAASILTLATPITWMLKNQPSLIWAFFFGLVLASVLTVVKRVKKWNFPAGLAAVAGGAFAFWLVGALPQQTPETWWFIMFSGAIAICAMILPGISGAFILLLLNKYMFILDALHGFKTALKTLDFSALWSNGIIIVFFLIGLVLGLSFFVRILGWLFRHYHDLTVAALIGFMVGSLRKVWPWKAVKELVIDGIPFKVESNILPAQWNGQVWAAIVLCVIGFAAVLVIEHVANRKEKQPQKD